MTKAKSNFCKTLVALIIGLALAITAFGGFSLINARADGELAEGAAADTLYLKVGRNNGSGAVVTSTTEAVGNLAVDGYTIIKSATTTSGFSADYILVVDSELLQFEFCAYYNGYCPPAQASDSSGASGMQWNAYDPGGDLGFGGKTGDGSGGAWMVLNRNSAGTGKHVVKMGSFFYFGDPHNVGQYGGSSGSFRITIISREQTEDASKGATGADLFDESKGKVDGKLYYYVSKGDVYEPFDLPALAVNMSPNGQSFCIDTQETANAIMNNKQGVSGVDDYLNKIKFYIKANDEIYTLKNVPGYTGVNIHYSGTNVEIYLRKTGDDSVCYKFQDGDALILEEGWRLIEEVDGKIQYAGIQAGKIKVLDREYKWIWHSGVCVAEGHFGYESNDFTGIAVDSEDAENGKVIIEKDLTANLTAIGLAGGELAPNCPANQDYEVDGHKVNEVTWASSDANIATVDANGVVTAKAVGTVTITATSVIDTTKTATISVEVIPADAITGIEITSNKNSVEIKNTLTLTATVTGGHQAATAATLVWSSSNENVATVDEDGVVTAVGKGTATITVSATSPSTTTAVTDSFEVTVTLPNGYVTDATVSANKTTLTVDEKVTLSVALVGSDDVSESIDVEITYASSDANIATVDANGVVTAVAAGKVTITVTVKSNNSEDVTKTIEITVNAANNGGDDEQEDNKKSGCGSNVIGTTSVIAGIALMMAAFVLIGKKRKENN